MTPMIQNTLLVALGGALGASLRHLTGLGLTRALGHGFPYGTLAVNVVGSFLMGAVVVLAAERGLTHLSPLVVTGLLGGFTTFSAFSLDAVTLWERGEVVTATAYVGASVALSIGALVLGLLTARALA